MIDEKVAHSSQQQRIGTAVLMVILCIVLVPAVLFIRGTIEPAAPLRNVVYPIAFLLLPGLTLLTLAQTLPQTMPPFLRATRRRHGSLITYRRPTRATILTYLPFDAGLVWLTWLFLRAGAMVPGVIALLVTVVFLGVTLAGDSTVTIGEHTVVSRTSAFGVTQQTSTVATDVVLVPGNLAAKSAAARWVTVVGATTSTSAFLGRTADPTTKDGTTVSNIITSGRDVNLMARDIQAMITATPSAESSDELN